MSKLGTSLSNISASGKGNVVDFGETASAISFQITANNTITAGAVQVMLSIDGTTFFAPPTALLTSLSAAVAANPFVLTTGATALFTVGANVAARYARVDVSTTITGAGGSATALISGK